MATQQAWEDFERLKSKAAYIVSVLSDLKDAINKYKENVEVISADPARVAAAAPIADMHHTYTTAVLLDLYNDYVTLAAYMTTNGYF
jgi:hypothetical protein